MISHMLVSHGGMVFTSSIKLIIIIIMIVIIIIIIIIISCIYYVMYLDTARRCVT